MKKEYQIFVVEDDVPVNSLITKFLQKQGYQQVRSFFSAEEMISEIKPDMDVIIVQDFDLPGKNGLQTIQEIKPGYPRSEFIFLSGQRSIEVAIEALKNGAFDYIVKDNFAKENVATKIKYLLKIKSLEKDRARFKGIFLLFSIVLIISWLIMLLLYIVTKSKGEF